MISLHHYHRLRPVNSQSGPEFPLYPLPMFPSSPFPLKNPKNPNFSAVKNPRNGCLLFQFKTYKKSKTPPFTGIFITNKNTHAAPLVHSASQFVRTTSSMGIHHHLLLPFLFLAALPLSTSYHHRTLLQSSNVSCPLNFDLLRRLVGSRRPNFDPATACRYAQQGLRLVEADYLRRTNSFVPPLNTAESCWALYQILANDFFPNFDLRRNCGFQTNWIAVSGCMNITNRQEFESNVSRSSLNPVVSACNQSLSGSSCSACTVALSTLQASDLNGATVGNLTDCRAYPFIYAAAFVNPFGPTDRGEHS